MGNPFEQPRSQSPQEDTLDRVTAIYRESFESMLDKHNPYSETLAIKDDGSFDLMRPDGVPKYVDAKSPNELYEMAQRVEGTYPNLQFQFQRDPKGKWMKYTVSRKEQ
jgi:hypothetical protein